MNGGMVNERPRTLRAEDRRTEIVRMLEQNGKLLVDDICQRFGVSAVTARADLNLLEERGKLRRIHGGALPSHRTLVAEDIEQRLSLHTQAKRSIARIANRLVHDGDALLIDSGSTAFEFLRTLDSYWGITIVTHDLLNASYVQGHLKNANLILLGGTVRPDHGYCYGALTLHQLNQLYVDKAFLATNSFSPDMGFMTENEGAAAIKTAMVAHADQRIMLLDSSKVGIHHHISFANLDDFEYIVMEEDPEHIVAKSILARDGKTRLLLK